MLILVIWLCQLMSTLDTIVCFSVDFLFVCFGCTEPLLSARESREAGVSLHCSAQASLIAVASPGAERCGSRHAGLGMLRHTGLVTP